MDDEHVFREATGILKLVALGAHQVIKSIYTIFSDFDSTA